MKKKCIWCIICVLYFPSLFPYYKNAAIAPVNNNACRKVLENICSQGDVVYLRVVHHLEMEPSRGLPDSIQICTCNHIYETHIAPRAYCTRWCTYDKYHVTLYRMFECWRPNRLQFRFWTLGRSTKYLVFCTPSWLPNVSGSKFIYQELSFWGIRELTMLPTAFRKSRRVMQQH